MNSTNIQKFDSLTGVRGILAGLVVIAHGFGRAEWMDATPWSREFLLSCGHFGVVGFFVLSGFILMSVYQYRNWTLREFSVNRFARIYPLYFVCLLFTLPIDLLSPGFQLGHEGEAFALTVVFQQSWLEFSNGRFNGPSWTLGVEFLFYASFPLLFVFQTKAPRTFLLFSFGLLIVTGLMWDAQKFELSHRVPYMRLWEFCAGISVAYFFANVRKKVRLPGNFTAWAMAALLCGLLAGAFAHRYTTSDFVEWLLMGICAILMILFLAFADVDNQQWRPLASQFWLVAGEISYGIYLVHDGIQRYAKVAIERVGLPALESLNAVWKLSFIFSSLVLSSIVALFLWKFLENPARSFLRKKLS